MVFWKNRGKATGQIFCKKALNRSVSKQSQNDVGGEAKAGEFPAVDYIRWFTRINAFVGILECLLASCAAASWLEIVIESEARQQSKNL